MLPQTIRQILLERFNFGFLFVDVGLRKWIALCLLDAPWSKYHYLQHSIWLLLIRPCTSVKCLLKLRYGSFAIALEVLIKICFLFAILLYLLTHLLHHPDHL